MTLRLVPAASIATEGSLPRRDASEPRAYPIQTLERAIRWPRISQLGILLALHPRQIYRLRQTGLTAAQADVLALRCGLHPCEVWEDW